MGAINNATPLIRPPEMSGGEQSGEITLRATVYISFTAGAASAAAAAAAAAAHK